MPSDPVRYDVVVLGAGPAGLAAAMYAARRGFSVAVVDRAEQCGGLAASITIDEQTVDLGSHRLHPSIQPDLLRDLQVMLGNDLQWRPRNGRIRLRERWLAFPLRPFDVVRHAPASFVASVIGNSITAPLRRRRGSRGSPGASFSEEVRRQLGPAIAEAFYEPYAKKLWGVGGSQLSGELFRRHVNARSVAAIVRKMLRGKNGTGFWYPAAGFGAICTALADDVVRRGGVMHMGVQIESLDLGPQGCGLSLSAGPPIRAQTIISTIPSAALLKALQAPTDVLDTADRLEFRGAVLVYLTIPRSRYTPFDAHYFPESSTVVSRLSEPKNYRTSVDDPAQRSVLCAEVPVTVGDALWSSGDDDLVGRVARELVEQGLPAPLHIGAHVERRTHVYPIYHLDFEQSRGLVESYLDSYPNLAVLGRQALFAHDNTHHALLMGKSVVDALDIDAHLDRERWTMIRRSFRDHVVED